MRALAIMALLAGGALAQPAAPVSAPKPAPSLKTVGPNLYWARVSAVVTEKLQAPKGVPGGAMARVRVTLSPDGAIVMAEVSGSSGHPAFDAAALAAAAQFAPNEAARVPVASDPKILTQVTTKGMTLIIQAPIRRTFKAMPLPNGARRPSLDGVKRAAKVLRPAPSSTPSKTAPEH